MTQYFSSLDWTVLAAYFAATMTIGLYFYKRSRTIEGFTAANRSVPGWAGGLSIFGSYVSSISFLALPGKAFAANWNPFVFSLSLPIATWAAVRYFLPYYRASGEVSAYSHLERRFGPWARTYAGACFLLTQLARIGAVTYLMALPLGVLLRVGHPRHHPRDRAVHHPLRLYRRPGRRDLDRRRPVGGADPGRAALRLPLAVRLSGRARPALPHRRRTSQIQPRRLRPVTRGPDFLGGARLRARNQPPELSASTRVTSSATSPPPPTGRRERACGSGACSMSPFRWSSFSSGPDCSPIIKSIPGTWTKVGPSWPNRKLIRADVDHRAPDQPVRLQDARQNLELKEIGDKVFPHFIGARLPAGVRGLLIAAIFAAAMSTLSTSINSSATLLMSDFYRRYVNRRASERQSMLVLYGGTVLWGLMGMGVALLLVRLTDNALDAWWTLSGIFGGGMLGLFLLGLISKKAGNPAAVAGVILGLHRESAG